MSALGLGGRETEAYVSNLAGVEPKGGETGALAEELRLSRPELYVLVGPDVRLLCRRVEYFDDDSA